MTTTMQVSNAKELPFIWKHVTYDLTRDDGTIVKMSFDGKFANDGLIAKTINDIEYEGTFNENYCLHGDHCKITANNVHSCGFELEFEYEGEFDNGRFKKGILRSGKHGYYKYNAMNSFIHRNSPKDCYITCKGEFDLDSGYLLKGKLTHYINEPTYCINHITGKYELHGYIKSKKGTFSQTNPYTLKEGKQTLHNGVIMEGKFNGEQLRHGKVIYPSSDNNHGTKIIEGDFTNGVFDQNGKFYKGYHEGRDSYLIEPKSSGCTIM